MTTESDFHRRLDAHPDDHCARLVFADWLEERGDPRSDGYRALGALRLQPYYERRPSHLPTIKVLSMGRWCWFNTWFKARRTGPRIRQATLPQVWKDTLERSPSIFPTRREAEDAAALAFSKLSARRRAELLAGQSAAA